MWVIFIEMFTIGLLSTDKSKKSQINSQTNSQKTLESTYIEKNNEDEKLKKTKSIKENINLRIQFCQSWSHKGFFNQVKRYFEWQYSNISVFPENYSLPLIRKILYYLITFIQISTIGIIFARKILKNLVNGFISNEVFDWIENNRMILGMGAFLGGKILVGMITNTGAFEIYLNDKLIWSAINNKGNIPQIQGIEARIKRTGLKLMRKAYENNWH